MTLLRPIPTKRFAVARVDSTLFKVFSMGVAAVMAETFINAFRQIEQLNITIFSISIAIYGLLTAGILISSWLFGDPNLWLRLFAITTLVALLTWPLHFDPSLSSSGYQPWIWWTMGLAMICGGASFPFVIGMVYVLTMPVLWFFLKTSEFGGSFETIPALQECIHVFIFSTSLVAMVTALRWEAAKADAANQRAIASAVESARIDAVELERSRLDALVHDSVLTTLLVASRAESEEQKRSAAKSASEAIQRLAQAASSDTKSESLTLTSFAGALQYRVKEASPEFEIEVSRLSDLPIPGLVAQALTEATLQAVDNSLKHAPGATERAVRVSGQSGGLKIVISDNGAGFRPSQIPKDRLGLRASIIGRVEGAGGKVFLNTRPGFGTTVVIQWGTDG